MGVTVESIFVKSLSLIDELLPTGAYEASKVADYKGRTPSLVDMIQKELYRSGDLYSQYELSRTPILNMLGQSSNFDIQEYKGVELTFETMNDSYGGVKSYYFECDGGNGAVYIEDYTSGWNTLAAINLVNTGTGFVAYKGAVTPTTGATKSRIRFAGSYYYRTINRALFNYPFESGKEPVYAPWVKVTLPSTVKSIDKVIVEYETQQYNADDSYKIERSGNTQYLYVDYFFNGKLRVQYKPVPTTITATTDTLQVDDITANVIAYGLAKWFMAAEENQYLAKLFNDKFNELKAESNLKQPSGVVQIKDYYGTSF